MMVMVCLIVDNAGWGPTGSAVQHGDSQEQDWRHGAQPAQQVGPGGYKEKSSIFADQ